MSSADFFYAADPSTTTTPTWFTLSNQGTSETPKMKLGALTWNGTVFQIATSATVPLHGWSPGFLAAAPELGFPAFTGDQAAIYTYVSGLFPLPTAPDSPPKTDIRALYDHTGDSGKFETFAGKISGVQKISEIPHSWPQLPSNNNWSDQDWSTVVKIISDECIAVDTILNHFNRDREVDHRFEWHSIHRHKHGHDKYSTKLRPAVHQQSSTTVGKLQ